MIFQEITDPALYERERSKRIPRDQLKKELNFTLRIRYVTRHPPYGRDYLVVVTEIEQEDELWQVSWGHLKRVGDPIDNSSAPVSAEGFLIGANRPDGPEIGYFTGATDLSGLTPPEIRHQRPLVLTRNP